MRHPKLHLVQRAFFLMLICVVCTITRISAQTLPGNFNLVPNPSFEFNYASYSASSKWDTSIANSHICWIAANKFGNPLIYDTGVMYRFIPRTGKCAALMALDFGYGYDIPTHQWQDSAHFTAITYHQTRLLQPLTAGTTYYFTIYVGAIKVTDMHPLSDIIGNIGVYFSASQVRDYSNFGRIKVVPQIRFTSWTIPAYDTFMYAKLTATYTATGGEQYMTIGDFDYYDQQNFVYLSPLSVSYGYTLANFYTSLDDVSLVSDTTQAMINLNEFSLGNDTVLCPGQSLTLGGQPYFFHYWWSTGDTTRFITVNSAGTYWCRVDYGCNTYTDTIVIRSSHLDIRADTNSICTGNSVVLHATGLASYSWSPATSLSCTACSNPLALPSATTTYFVTGIDSNGCAAHDSINIAVRSKPTLTVSSDQTICSGSKATVKAAGATSYIWQPATSLSCATCDSAIAEPDTTTLYTVIGTTNGCEDTQYVHVTVNRQPKVTVSRDTTICAGDSLRITATGADAYWWYPATALSCTYCADPIASPTASTVYYVAGTDTGGCADTGRVAITVLDGSQMLAGPGDTICRGASVHLSAGGGTSYKWIPAAGLNNDQIPDPIATPDTTTTYRVIIRQNACFLDSFYITVTVYPDVSVDAGPDRTILAGEETKLGALSLGDVTYKWQPADGLSCTECADPLATPQKTITYTVTAANAGGCSATDSVTVHVKCDNSEVFVPNTFTPNGDGLNDWFYASGKGLTTIKSFKIYDRWGEEVFSRENIPFNNPIYGWDGTVKGKQVAPNVFVYVIDATCLSGELFELKGTITLVR